MFIVRLTALLVAACLFLTSPTTAQTITGGEALGDAASDVGNYGEAYYQYQSACMYGDGQRGACHKAGDMHANGYGVPKDERAANEYYGYACKAGDADTCGALGAQAAIAGDQTKARELFNRACELNDPEGCLDYGRSLTLGLGGPEDREGARVANRKACALGVADGCKFAVVPDEPGYAEYRAAMTAIEAGDSAGAKDLLINSCVTGHFSDACAFFARRVHEGRYPGMSSVDERDYLRLACVYDDKKVLCAAYADMVHAGIGGPRDDTAALIVYHDACNAFLYADACYGQAMIMHAGTAGGPYKAADIGALFLHACKDNHRAACYELALMFRAGEGLNGKSGAGNALVLFKQECGYDNAKACAAYGDMLAAGEGVPADPAGAEIAWKKACDGGVDAACKQLGAPVFAAPSAKAISTMSADEAYAAGLQAYARKNYTLARDLYIRACDQASALSCTALGSIYQAGQTGQTDLMRARVSYQRACELGSGLGCSQAGRMLRFGEGGPEDDAGGYALYAKACNLTGDSNDCATAAQGEQK